jgi:hypothetical protein
MSINNYIRLSTVVEEFDNHIIAPTNKRTLFSARFGAGKSTFIKDFFDNKFDDYIVLKLYPVNYSVASNEDVFELIKYDLFTELLFRYNKEIAIDEKDFSTILIAQSYLLHDLKIYSFMKALLKLTTPISDAAFEVGEAAKIIYDNFIEYKNKMQHNERGVINDYTEWCNQRKGSIYERDEITALLSDLIARVKKKHNKPVVLVIDDLDRLDPEHVFRLFNVFSAHYDATTDVNKFGVDKVIFVCDYNNIQLMYAHRYGVGVDFEGYINKFYSSKIFQFDPVKYLKENTEKILNGKPYKIDDRFIRLRPNVDSDSIAFRSLKALLSELIVNKQITFRSLDNFKAISLPTHTFYIGDSAFQASSYPFIIFIHLITQSISLNALLDALLFLESKDPKLLSKGIYGSTIGRALTSLINQSLFVLLDELEVRGLVENLMKYLTVGSVVYTITYKFNNDTETMQGTLVVPDDGLLNIYGCLRVIIIEAIRKNIIK